MEDIDSVGAILLPSRIHPPTHFSSRLQLLSRGLSEHCLVLIPGNSPNAINPLAGLEWKLPTSIIDLLTAACCEGHTIPVRSEIKGAVFIPPGCHSQANLKVALTDSMYFLDSGEKPGNGSALDPQQSTILGLLRMRLQRLSKATIAEIDALKPSFDGLLDPRTQQVTLHISHSWGGGIERWIRDQQENDSGNCHLVLASASERNSSQHGQRLRLYGAGPGRILLREFPLIPAIEDTDICHSGYQAILNQVLRRYGVSKIIVSSLIGHSLDALQTGLTTVQVFHDYYPAWPILDQDPLAFLTKDNRLRRKYAFSLANRQNCFSNHNSEYWRELADSWFQRLHVSNAILIAPTKSTALRIHLLSRKRLKKVHIIGHGFSGWPQNTLSIKPVDRKDGRLQLVVIGRLAPGKGLELLTSSLHYLRKYAHLILLGSGQHGHRFFGLKDIDVILEYERETLPQQLQQIAPAASLFLSTVPETWNYVLSETRSLGIVPIATNIGSFRERIKHNENGILFKPTPQGLGNAIRVLFDNKKKLEKMRAALPVEKTIEEAINQYDCLLSKSETNSTQIKPFISAHHDFIKDVLASNVADQNQKLNELKSQLAGYQSELEKRTEWAFRLERLRNEKSKWAQSLKLDLDKASVRINSLNAQLQDREQELENRTRWAKDQEQIAQERTRWAQSLKLDLDKASERINSLNAQLQDREQELENRTRWAKDQEQIAQERTRWAQSLKLDLDKASERINSLNAQLQDREQELENRTRWAKDQEQIAQERTRWAQSLKLDLDKASERINSLNAQLQDREQELENRTRWAKDQEQIAQERIGAIRADFEQIIASRSWQLTRPLRVANRLLNRIRLEGVWNPFCCPRVIMRLLRSLRKHGLQQTIYFSQLSNDSVESKSSDFRKPENLAPKRLQPVRFSYSYNPKASVIIPVFNKLEYTQACLVSLAKASTKAPFEVIVVNDCSTDSTSDFLASCQGLKTIQQKTNRGFISSCNLGSSYAIGEFLIFLNNDTEVSDDWLDALIDTFSNFPDAGIVGGRLLFSDGRLQEAGGIIFCDGSGWNYGRGDDPDRPEYNFLSPADYVSGACLAIRASDFSSLGGFDHLYTPAYYEDTDLCFKIRQIGKQVIYQPACIIKHFEGITSGRDTSRGVKQYQELNRAKFVARWKKQLASQPIPVSGVGEICQIRDARHHSALGHVLVIDAVTPAPDQDSGSVRMEAILQIARDMGWKVSFIPENLAPTKPYTMRLQQLGIEVIYSPWVQRADDWLAENGKGLDVIIVSRHYVLKPILSSLRKYAPQAKLVFDTVDLHFLREEREARVCGNKIAANTARLTRKNELHMMLKTDCTLVVSNVEYALLSRLVPNVKVKVLSNIHTPIGSRKPWSDRNGLMFVGGFQHPPNLDAAWWLIREIFPLICKELEDVVLHLIGSKMPPDLLELSIDGICVHGFVPDIEAYLDSCRVALAPLRYGAGVKGKVNQAMAYGLPVVATSCAAEGMFLEDDKDILVADDAIAFARQVVRLYTTEKLWSRLSYNGPKNVEKYFSRDAAKSVLRELLSKSSLVSGKS